MIKDKGTTVAIKVTPYVKDLMTQVQSKISKEKEIEVGINATMRFILEKYLEKDE